MRRRELSIAQLTPHSACPPGDMLVGGSAEFARLGRASRDASADVGFVPDEVTEGVPRGKMAKVVARARSMGQLRRFEAPTRRANVARGYELSLKCVAAGIRC